MNINIVDINKMALNMEKMNVKLEVLIKQLEKNKIKYPIGLTYDQLYRNTMASVESGEIKKFKIVKLLE
jgi:hypothetical protein